MKSTTYIVEIANQKNEKYLSSGEKSTCLLAFLPPRLVSTKKYSAGVY